MKRAERIAQSERDAKMRKFRVERHATTVPTHESINDASEQNGLRRNDLSAFLEDDDDALYW